MGETLKDCFAADSTIVDRVCHELRRPVAVIDAYAELLADELSGPLNVEQKAHLAIMHRNARRMNRMIQDLFEVFHTVMGDARAEHESKDIEQLAYELAEELEDVFEERKVKLSLHTDGAVVHPALDTVRLKTALTRLLEHALRFSPEGGEVYLRIRRLGERVRFEVRDTGPYLSKDEVAHVFDFLHRPERARQGEDPGGADLTVCRAMVERLGGKVWAEDRTREGTTFVIELSTGGSEPGFSRQGGKYEHHDQRVRDDHRAAPQGAA